MDIKIYKLLSISLMYRSIYIQNNIVHVFDQNNIFIENKNRRFIARLRKARKARNTSELSNYIEVSSFLIDSLLYIR